MRVIRERAFILQLPEELLDNIVQEACRMDKVTWSNELYENWEQRQKYWEERFRTPASLCLVCRRLNRIAMPYLYADLATGRTPREPNYIDNIVPSLKLLHRSCRNNPDLWRLCRRLTVDYDGRTGRRRDALGYIADDLTTWLTEARSFSFTALAFASGDAWRLCRHAMSNFEHLEALSLRSENCDIDVPWLFDILNKTGSSKLRTLELSGLSLHYKNTENRTPKLEPGTASLTTLRLQNFFLTPPVLKKLMRWAPSLEHFFLESADHDCSGKNSYPWSLATLQPILAINRKTLRTIDISINHQPGLSGFDMRPFERLEEIRLTACTMFRLRETAAVDSENMAGLLAPSLRIFHFDLTLDKDPYRDIALDSFGVAEQNWIRQFAQIAVEKNCPLREIEIEFCPYPGFISIEHCNMCIYPWDRMDALARELAPDGIQVSYSRPNLSRDDWAGALQTRCDCDGDRPCFACSGRRGDVPELEMY